jgi:uncharacterized protein YjiK
MNLCFVAINQYKIVQERQVSLFVFLCDERTKLFELI